MPEFAYRGIGPQDVAVEGCVLAADHEQANKLLAQMQVRVAELKAVEARPTLKVKLVSAADFALINDQIIAMVKAGVPLESGFASLASDLGKPRLRRLINELAEDLASGTSLEEAIRKRQQAFPTLYAQVVAVGIRTGRLAVVLAGFNRYLEFTGSIRRMVWEVLNYPLVIMILALGVLYFTTRVVTPGFEEIMKDFGTSLPVLTQLVFTLSHHLHWLFPAVVITIAAIVIAIHSARWPAARRAKEQIVLAIPSLGNAVKNCLIARFTQGLALMVRTGVPLPDAVLMAGEATGSPAVMTDAQRVHDSLSRGESVHQALQVGCILPRFLGQTVQIGLDRNQLDECLEELSHLYDQRAQQNLSTLRMLLLPLMIIFTGGTIGIYVIALFLPLVKLISSVSGGK